MGNNIDTTQTRQAFLRTPDTTSENRTYEFVISTESRDTYGTVFRADGWDLKGYEKNPIVAYNHRTWSEDPNAVIGTSEVFREGKSLIGRVTLEEGNPIADAVKRKIDNGSLRMASVGADVKEYHRGVEADGEDTGTIYFTRQELIEWSVVPAGSNRDAHKRNQESITQIRSAFVKDIQEPKQSKEKQTSVRDAQLISYNY